MNKKNILIFIVAYNAESHIEDVLDRIPRSFLSDKKNNIEILIIDESYLLLFLKILKTRDMVEIKKLVTFTC